MAIYEVFWMKKEKTMNYGLLTLLFFSVIFVSGCTNDTTYDQPSKITSSTTSTTQEETTQIEQEKPKVQTFDIGETATDKELKITVNTVKYTILIDEQNNEFMIAEAPSDKQYVILDITVENVLPDKTQTISTLMNTEIIDTDGYTYDLDLMSFMSLDKSFKDGDILPGMKKRGELVYEVPSTAKNLKFAYKFDLIGTTALFNI